MPGQGPAIRRRPADIRLEHVYYRLYRGELQTNGGGHTHSITRVENKSLFMRPHPELTSELPPHAIPDMMPKTANTAGDYHEMKQWARTTPNPGATSPKNISRFFSFRLLLQSGFIPQGSVCTCPAFCVCIGVTCTREGALSRRTAVANPGLIQLDKYN